MKLLCFCLTFFMLVSSYNAYASDQEMSDLSCEELEGLNEQLHAQIRDLKKGMTEVEINQQINSCYQRGLANIPPSELLDFCTLAGKMILSDIHYSAKCGD